MADEVNMKIIADYHTHTKYSHGIGSIEDNVISAREKGLLKIAITEHGPACPYGIKLPDYFEMRQTVSRLQEKYRGSIEIILGLEANIIDEQGRLDIPGDIISDCDILLAGFHFDIIYQDYLQALRAKLNRRQKIKAVLDPGLYEEITARNTQAMIKALAAYPIDIFTHPGDNYPVDIVKIAQVAQNRNTALEINNAHKILNAAQIKVAMSNSTVSFVISSDAHRPCDVGKFTWSVKLLEETGLDVRRVRNIAAVR